MDGALFVTRVCRAHLQEQRGGRAQVGKKLNTENPSRKLRRQLRREKWRVHMKQVVLEMEQTVDLRKDVETLRQIFLEV